MALRGADVIEQADTIAAELRARAGILGVTTAESLIGGEIYGGSMPIPNEEGEVVFGRTDLLRVGEDFTSVMGIGLIDGVDLSSGLADGEGRSAIVSESFVRAFGWTDPIGKRLPPGNGTFRVVGVVQDFHVASLHDSLMPAILIHDALSSRWEGNSAAERAFAEYLMIVELSQDRLDDSFQVIEQTIAQFSPVFPFEFEFLDERIARLYQDESRSSTILGGLSILSVLIACLGLYGLTASTTDQRTKEIGGRRVLGATGWEIVFLLSKRTLVLIAIGGLAASLVVALSMSEWLSGFAYRISISPGYFVLSVLGVAAIALTTIAVQTWHVATADQSQYLRYE